MLCKSSRHIGANAGIQTIAFTLQNIDRPRHLLCRFLHLRRECIYAPVSNGNIGFASIIAS